MKKGLLLLLLSGMLGLIPAASVCAEELSSGDTADIILEETAPMDVLSAGDGEEVLLESDDTDPAAGSSQIIQNGTWGTCPWA